MDPPAPFLGVAVIGHVNHGKTALVRALTGIETDRLPEEKARGLSIALGFAWRDYPGGGVDFLDAPGHEDFLRAMVMGAAAARAVLLVVSGPEGFARQTREHLRIAGLLGLSRGVVAIAKSDLVPAGDRSRILDSVSAELSGGALAAAPRVFCSSVTGEGLDDLHAALAALAGEAPAPDRLPGAFLPVDRVFSPAGTGTVVTGSLRGGGLAAGGDAVLMPSGRTVRLRGLQVHGRAVDAASPGSRVAAALRGAAVAEVPVGEVLCAPGAFEASLQVDAEVTLAPDASRPLRSGDEVRVLWGARQDMARVRVIAAAALAPGDSGLVQLRFASPRIAFAGQRALLRRPSPAETLGGARVLDPVAPVLRGRTLEARARLLAAVSADAPSDGLAELARRDGGAVSLREASRLWRRSGQELTDLLGPGATRVGEDLLILPGALDQARATYLGQLAAAHRNRPSLGFVPLGTIRRRVSRDLSAGLVEQAEQALVREGAVRVQRGGVALAGHDPFSALPPGQLARLQWLEAEIRRGGVSPPAPEALEGAAPGDGPLIALLLEAGRVVALRNHALRQTLLFHVAALDAALDALALAFPPPMEFTTGQAREALATRRKFIVPVLEFLDSRGDAVRQGDLRRLAGPRNRFGDAPGPI